MQLNNKTHFLLLAYFMICLVFSSPVMAAETINVWFADANTKIRPQAAQGVGTSFAIGGAINETVSLQFAVSPTAETLTNVDVSVSLAGGFTTTIYREGFMHVITPTHVLGDTGEWPDIMIPKVDSFYGEARNAFPTTLSNISQVYPFINATPQKKYGPGNTSWDTAGFYWSKEIPPSGFVYPNDGTQTTTGLSYKHNTGTGSVSTSGAYTGGTKSRYVIIVDGGGAIGTATFKWSADNGAAFTTGVTTSASPVSLGNGVNVTFAGAGAGTDFVVDDEWLFYVAPTRNQPVWVDIYIPKTMIAGSYPGTITVAADGKTDSVLSFSLTVHDFALPDTSSLPNLYFGYNYDTTDGHKLSHSNPLDRLYVADGLRHRISMPHSINEDAGGGNVATCTAYNEGTGLITMDYTGMDAAMGPFMDGAGSITVPTGTITFPGKLTFIDEPRIEPWNCTIVDSELFTQRARTDIVSHFKAKGWFDRFHVYLADEPNMNDQAQWDALITKGQAWRAAAPDANLLVTTDLRNAVTKSATAYIDTYVAVSRNEIAANNPEAAGWRYPRANYDTFVDLAATPKKDVWWYSACFEGGGCDAVGGTFYNYFANLSIDSTSLENTMRPWLTRYYDYHGDLYYDVNFYWNKYANADLDPWDTSYGFSVNGDGQLFYPGRPDKIGGTLDIPLESLRLKLIRNGMQAYEYMHRLDRKGEQAFVQSQLATIMSNVQNFTTDPNALARVKENFATRIEAITVRPPSNLRTP